MELHQISKCRCAGVHIYEEIGIRRPQKRGEGSSEMKVSEGPGGNKKEMLSS
jgi:hypothetical protein